MKILHEYKGIDKHNNRRAEVTIDKNGDYGVRYIINDIVEYRIFPDHSIHYAEDAAENWVLGIISPNDLQTNF
jgi:hypothetical protein